MDVNASLDLINHKLEELPRGQKPSGLYEPMAYILGAKSPRFYPLLTLWSCYLFSGGTKKALSPSLGIEVFYNFLIVHGDLLDKWDRNVAILSGDAMIFKAYELLIQVDSHLIKPVVKKFNQCFIRVCEGKQLILNNPQLATKHEMLKLGHGAVGDFAMQLGALAGSASTSQQQQAGKLGSTIAVNHSTIQPFNHSTAQLLSELSCDEVRKQKFWQWLITTDYL